jgi:serine/threonine protein kinase
MSDETITNISNGGELDRDGTRKAPTPNPLDHTSCQDLSGTAIGGYKLIRKVAEGGMGVVYEAIQTKLDRKVALKVLTEQLGWRPEFLQRFEREAKAAAALNHPNMVQVFDYGEAAGRHYIIMEFIEGQNLSSYTEQVGKIAVDEALNLIEQAAQALKAAAEKSIIHRDIKPSNLLLTQDGRVKVADLGLAKILSQDSELTLSSVSIGSPHFIAPEQADDSRSADHRADIYSLGVTLLFLLTGKHAYDGNSPISIVLAHTNKPLPSGAELGTPLPSALESLIHRMAAKDPKERYQDYQSLIVDLNRVRAGFTPSASVGERAKRRSQLILASAVIASIAVLAAAAILWPRPKTAPPSTVPTQVSASDQQNRFGSRGADAADQRARFPRPEPNEQRPRFADGGQFEPTETQGGPHAGGPMGPPARREFYTIPEGSPSEMLAKADQYASLHGDKYEEVINCYRQLEDRFAETRLAPEIAKRKQEWIVRAERARKEAFDVREAKMRELIKVQKWQEAWNVWRDFPPSLRIREIDEQVRELVQNSFPNNWRPDTEPR